MSADFDAFWAAYPRRRGANPRAPARTSWDRATKRGASSEAILAGAKAYATDPSTKAGTEFVPMAVTWLNQRRWEDYKAAPRPVSQTAPASFLVAMDSPQWEAWAKHLGKTPPINRQFGWRFPSEWPPGHDIGQEPTKEKGRDPDWNPEAEFISTEDHDHSSEFIR